MRYPPKTKMSDTHSRGFFHPGHDVTPLQTSGGGGHLIGTNVLKRVAEKRRTRHVYLNRVNI